MEVIAGCGIIDESADDSSRVRSKGAAVMAGRRAGSVAYDDVVVRTPAGWRIARRAVLARRAV